MPADSLPEPIAIALADGAPAQIRPIRPDDARRLQAFHARLSSDTIYLRWLSAHPALSDAEAETLANVDYVRRMAFVAVRPTPQGETVIGVARYNTLRPDHPGVAEAAVVVEDAYQHQGLGTQLMRRLLAYAQARGVRTLVAEVNAENARMLRFIRRSGLPVTQRLEGGSWEIRVDISGVK